MVRQRPVAQRAQRTVPRTAVYRLRCRRLRHYVCGRERPLLGCEELVLRGYPYDAELLGPLLATLL